MSANPQAAIVPLRLIAAQAQKLADDIAAGKLWRGDFNDGLRVIEKALRDARTAD